MVAVLDRAKYANVSLAAPPRWIPKTQFTFSSEMRLCLRVPSFLSELGFA